MNEMFPKDFEEDTPELVRVIQVDQRFDIPSNTWIHLIGTGIEVYQFSGDNAILFVTVDNVIQPLTHTQWLFRKHTNGS